jgi:3-hydroxybutyryl-CoA dehydratase
MEDAFLALAGDTNPLHIQDTFAIQQGFATRLAHGLLVASVALPAVAEAIGTPGFMCLAQTIRFHRAVLVNNEVRTTATIKHVTEGLGIVVVGIEVHVGNSLVLSGEIQAKTQF